MSLVNQMLLDLDARANHQNQGQHRGKLAFLPVVHTESTLKKRLWFGLGIVIAIGAIVLLYRGLLPGLLQKSSPIPLAGLPLEHSPVTAAPKTPAAQTVADVTPQKNIVVAHPTEITLTSAEHVNNVSNDTLAVIPQPLPATKIPLQKKLKPKNSVTRPIDPQLPDYRDAAQLYRQGRISEAESKLQHILQQFPRHQPSRDMLLDLFLSQNRLNQAQQLLRNSMTVYPQQTQYVLALARIYLEQHQGKDALSLLQDNYTYGKDQAEYVAFLGMVYFAQKQYANAVSHYQAALNLKNTEGRWWLGLGLAQESLHNSQGAVSAFRKAMEDKHLNPKVIEFLEQRILQHQPSN